MPKITQVDPQKKNNHRFNIFLDGEFAFGADEDLVVNRRLIAGKIITPEDLQKILFEAEVGKLMERMYRWFSLRQHSETEVRQYFRVKNLESRVKGEEERSKIIIDAVIENLKKKGMVNDLEFALAWVAARRKSRQKGIKAIKAELFQKGIDKEIIESVTSDMLQVASEEDLAKLALEKKMKYWKNLSVVEFHKKATEFLLRKGFDYEIVKTALDKYKPTSEFSSVS